MIINNLFDLEAALSAGPYTWPGAYPTYFITDDGEALSFEDVVDNLDYVRDSVMNQLSDGWRVVALDVNYEDHDLLSAHSGQRIECAYAE